MDTTKTITHIGLCAGYGGIELGLKRVLPNLRSVALCEIEAFAVANLVAKMEAGLMEPAPIWTDLKTFPWEEFSGRVDILTGGYPCQPFSAAGKRLGTDDQRHLWPFIASGIRILRPKLCFFENVEGHISLGLREVIGELEQIGYTTAWGIFSASEVGAPHQRKRVFILAVSNSLGGAAGLSRSLAWNEGVAGVADHCGDQGCGELANAELHGHDYANARPHTDGIQGPFGQWHEHRQAIGDGQVWPSHPGELQHAWEPPRVVANSHRLDRSAQAEGWEHDRQAGSASEAMGNPDSQRPQERTWQRGAGIQGTHADGGETADGQTQPAMGRDADGPAGGLGYAELCVSCDNRTDELRLLGNGVVPATAERAFRTLLEELNT